jgi:hypothetical protein
MTMNLRLSPPAEEALAAMAASNNLTKTKMIETLIMERSQQRDAGARLGFLAREITEGRADLMDRLRDA